MEPEKEIIKTKLEKFLLESANLVITTAIKEYGKPGGPWNVPGTNGGFIAMCHQWKEAFQVKEDLERVGEALE